jgi:hypothetical protein
MEIAIAALVIGIPLWIGVIYAVWRMERKDKEHVDRADDLLAVTLVLAAELRWIARC